MKKILRGLFLIFYLALLTTGVWVSRTFAVFLPAPLTSSSESWKDSVPEFLPEHDNQPQKDSFSLEGREIFPAFKIKAQEDDQGQLLEFFNPEGFAFRVEKTGPYGPLVLILGLSAEGQVTGLRHLLISEPRGVGRAFEKADFFWESFKGKTRDDLFLVSEGGKIPPILGALESSRRYTEMIRKEIENFQQNKDHWIQEAMRGRRSFEDLKALRDEESQPSPLTDEDQDEKLSSELF